MIYGDNPLTRNEHEDALGLNTYTLIPDIVAILASGNLYVYAINNPIKFNDPFGLKPGDLFPTIEDAVCDFADYVQPFSVGNGWEYGTFFYIVFETIQINLGIITITISVPRFTYYEPWTDERYTEVQVTEVVNGNRDDYFIVATAHTHPSPKSRSFSEPDKENAVTRGMDNYVVLGNGDILRYNYRTDKVSKLDYITLHDYRSRFNLIWRWHNCPMCVN
jgi:hypothetical protein